MPVDHAAPPGIFKIPDRVKLRGELVDRGQDGFCALLVDEVDERAQVTACGVVRVRVRSAE
ncbi:hypothetical protein ABCR94_13505 [Streptomyces sp. 21So2-11]|uniref:hypothetical protein n=1 Tax=Streptomyces sp. 21So2-11 TaxID=3144408 RepID=UPI00321B99DC